MRFKAFAASCVLIAGSAGSVKTLAASPDCARWIKEYQQGLAKRAVLGKKHVTHAAHRLVRRPLRPRLTPVSGTPHRVHPPKLSPQEMLKRFKVLCGEDLPSDTLPVEFTPTGLEEAFIPTQPVNNEPTFLDDGGGQPAGGQPTGNTPAQTAPPTLGVFNPLIPTIPGAPIIGGGGGGTTTGGGGTTTGGGGTTTGGGGTTTGGGGGTTTGGGGTTTGGGGTTTGGGGTTTGGDGGGGTTTPVSPVPEPGSLLLVATGALGALPFFRRRMSRQR